MASWLVHSGASCPGLSRGQGHCVVFSGKILPSHSASSTQVYKWVLANWGKHNKLRDLSAGTGAQIT